MGRSVGIPALVIKKRRLEFVGEVGIDLINFRVLNCLLVGNGNGLSETGPGILAGFDEGKLLSSRSLKTGNGLSLSPVKV